ncbi:MAG: flagellar basal body L-ring protein FlgH [Anaerohalosphaeraceae bacterium]|nr:flagellar basal body L-ring protein FlgH [Anaerohalosphaeraceae bacterium]
MSKTRLFILVFAVSLIVSPADLSAGSLWAKKNTAVSSSTYADDVAREIGDVLTIVISEVSNIANTSDRDLSKTTKRNQQFDGKIGIDHIIASMPTMEFGTGTEHTNTFKSNANNNDNRSFKDNITVMVIDVMPNGNLVVSGTCKRNISDDVQMVEITGIVRPSDIAYDNTVDSKRVANVSVLVKYGGVGASFNRPGWLGSILDIIWPF